MKKIWLLLVWIVGSMSQLNAQQYDLDTFQAAEFYFGKDTLRYRVLYPEGYGTDQKAKYPLVVFLHGRGESGSDNYAQLKHGSSLFLDKDTREKYPAVVIFPQCPDDDSWAKSMRDPATKILAMPSDPEQTNASFLVQNLIKYYLKNEPIDKKRVYIMGLSMGGMGTLDMLVRNPKMFASAISICGAIESPRLKKLKKMPIRFYHGTDDEVVPASFSRDAFYELKARGSSVVEIIEYVGVGHDSWDPAFGSSDFLEWLFSFKR